MDAHETLGYTILEAMACGLPVIASRVGAVPELVGDGKTGKLVPFGDPEALAAAIVRLLGDAAARHAMGRLARQRATAEYGLCQTAARMVRFYDRARARYRQSAATGQQLAFAIET